MKVMVLTPYLPHRRVGHGGGTAVRDLITWLAYQHDVLVAALVRPGEAKLVSEVEQLGVKVAALPFPDNNSTGSERCGMATGRLQALLRSVVSGYPLYVEKYWSRNLSRELLKITAEFAPDAVQVEYLQMSLLCRDLRQQRQEAGQTTPRLVLNSHELGSLPRERRAAKATNPLAKQLALNEAASWRKLQLAATSWADKTLCVTEQDHHLFQQMGGQNLVTVPLGMDTQAIENQWQPQSPERFLFVGSFGHRPNRLAAELLVEKIWPQVAEQRPNGQLIIAGRGSTEFLADKGSVDFWQERRVQALGFVDDLTPHFNGCTQFVAPLPEGGGIKIKILEAMARGIPIVTTPVGAEGIANECDDVLVICDDIDKFAKQMLQAISNPSEAASRAKRARKLIEDKYSWAAITEILTEIYTGA